MALAKLGAMFTELSGKIGGTSISNYGITTVLKNITQRNTVPTIKQSNQRFILSKVSNLWSSLTTAQKNSWGVASTDYTYVNRVGQIITRNGYQTFCFCNLNLILIGQTVILDAPIFIENSIYQINVVDISNGVFIVDSPTAQPKDLYAVFGVANLPNGVKSSAGRLKFLNTINSTTLVSGYDAVPDLEAVYGSLSFPNTMAISIQPINQTTGNRNTEITIIENQYTPMILVVEVLNGDTVNLPFQSGGVYDFSISWGDGTITNGTTHNAPGKAHTYTKDGRYNIAISGKFPGFRLNVESLRDYWVDLLQFGNNQFTTLRMSNATLLSVVNCVDTPNLAPNCDLTFCFSNMFLLTEWKNLTSWDLSEVTLMPDSFRGVTIFDQALNELDVSNVQDFGRMFRQSDAFSQDISSWDMSNATSINSMFYATNNFNQDISSWDVSNVQDFGGVFNQNILFDQDLSSWDISSATNMVWFGRLSAFSVANWDAMLIAWNNLPAPPQNITIDMKPTHSATAQAAYDNLINVHGWTINENV